MALTEHQSEWTEQPDSAVGLNPDHWLTPRVIQGIAAHPLRSLTGVFRHTVSTAREVDSPAGRAMSLTGSGGYVSSPTVTDSQPWTLISYGSRRSTATFAAVATVAEAPGNATVDRSLGINASGTVDAAIYDGSNRFATTTRTLDTGVPGLVAAVASGTTLGAYCQGELVTTATSNSGYAAYTTPELVHGYGHMRSSTAASQWDACWTLLVRGALTLAELRELEACPWAVFDPALLQTVWEVAGGGITLAVSDSNHAHTSDNITLSTSLALSIADAAHAHTAQAPALSTDWLLTVAAATHAHASDSLALNTQTVLAAQDSAHAHTSENVVLGVAGATTLAVADASHAHTVDGITLSTASLLAVQDALHAHAAENVTLQPGNALLIADSLHAHTSDGLALTVDAWLVVADATHAHRVDAVVLTLPGAAQQPSAAPLVPRLQAAARAARLSGPRAPRLNGRSR